MGADGARIALLASLFSGVRSVLLFLFSIRLDALHYIETKQDLERIRRARQWCRACSRELAAPGL